MHFILFNRKCTDISTKQSTPKSTECAAGIESYLDNGSDNELTIYENSDG